MTNVPQNEAEAVEQQTEEPDGGREAGRPTHLDDVEDGSGCTEIWEHLSERREEAADS